jgi:hypothetical protein
MFGYLTERLGLNRPVALAEMTRVYTEYMMSGEPVHTWPLH